MSQVGHRAGGRQIAQLALPALGVLAAEPLYLLFDIAVVGRLGAISLAGLAIGSLVLGLVGSQATFLSYGTTARAARRYGAGNRVAAVTEGVQATWLALGLGALVVVVVEATATPLVSAIASGDGITAAALPWLRIAILGTPAILVSLAGNGWLRGVQDTVRPLRYVVAGFGSSALLCPLLVYGWLGLPRWGLTGSAVANLVGQWLAALLFAGALLAERVSLRPDRAVLGAQLMMARDLIVRTLAFQVCYVSAAAVAARFGAAALAAHQVVLQLWGLLALVLDSLAIAAQSHWRKAAQLKRNEANDLRNERSLLAVNQGRTADDLLERYWRGEQRLATIAHQCEVKSDQSEQVADAVNYLRDRLTEIAQSGNQQINQILAGKGPIEAKVAAVNAVIEQSNAMADHVGATAMSNIIDATQRVFDETIGGDAHTWLRDHGVSLDTPARPRPVTAEDMTSMTANSPAGSPFGAAPSAPSHSTTTSGPPRAAV